MRFERSVTSISWIPSDSIPGLLGVPFSRGLMHYDPPPPLVLGDLDDMRARGEFRFANRCRAYIEVDDGRITDCGYTGGTVMGLTPVTAGPLRIMLPTKRNHEIQWKPAESRDRVTFVQTAGGRPGFSFLKPSWRWPFLVTKPFTIWTTLRLTIDVAGSATGEIIGASPFPRHWLYDDAGELIQKSALTRNQVWARTVFGHHTPWGGEEVVPDVAGPETPLERALADSIMGDAQPDIERWQVGEYLFRQGEGASSVVLVLDGVFEVRVDGRVVGQVGPGAVIGERAALEAGRRTADVRATTEARTARVAAGDLDLEKLCELAQGHRREEPT